MSGRNRQDQQSRQERRKGKGEELLLQDKKNKQFDNDWNLDWFKPAGLQIDCVEMFNKCTFSIVDAPSGCGKTSVALWYALNKIKDHTYSQLLFIKNPTEAGDDQIGYLSGSEQDKLMAHMDTTKRIFHEFISKNKLENELAKDKVRLTITNFLLGATFDSAIVIIDEAQVMSPSTIKLLSERCGKNTAYIILGDSNQRYSVKKRADGFADLIHRTTNDHGGIRLSKYPPQCGYIKMNRHDNQRSEGSKFINKIYEED